MRVRGDTLDNPYEAVVNHSMDAIFLTLPDGQILSANPAACDLFQLTENELIQGGRNAVMDSRDPRLGPALAERERTGRFSGELRFKKADGTLSRDRPSRHSGPRGLFPSEAVQPERPGHEGERGHSGMKYNRGRTSVF